MESQWYIFLKLMRNMKHGIYLCNGSTHSKHTA